MGGHEWHGRHADDGPDGANGSAYDDGPADDGHEWNAYDGHEPDDGDDDARSDAAAAACRGLWGLNGSCPREPEAHRPENKEVMSGVQVRRQDDAAAARCDAESGRL